MNKRVPATGFHTNPERINREGRADNGWTWRDLFMKIAEEKKDQLTRKEILAEAQWKKAEEGDTRAFEKIAERMEGKAPQSKEDRGSEDNPMHMQVTIKQL